MGIGYWLEAVKEAVCELRANSPRFRCGVVPISDASDTVEVTYSKPFSDEVDPELIAVIAAVGKADAGDGNIAPTIYTKTLTGFTVHLSAITTNANYTLNYTAGVER